MTLDTAQTADEVRVDQAAGLDLFEIDRITWRRKFESVCDQAGVAGVCNGTPANCVSEQVFESGAVTDGQGVILAICGFTNFTNAASDVVMEAGVSVDQMPIERFAPTS